MGIEWTSRLALSRAAAECQVAGGVVKQESLAFGREQTRIAVRRGGTAVSLSVMRAVGREAVRSSASSLVFE